LEVILYSIENSSQAYGGVCSRSFPPKHGGTLKHTANHALLSLRELPNVNKKNLDDLKERILCHLNTQGILAEFSKKNGDLYLRQKSSSYDNSFDYVSRNEIGFYYRHKIDRQKHVIIDSRDGTIYAFNSKFHQDKSTDFLRVQKLNYESILKNATYGKFRYLNFTISFEFSNLDYDLDPNISFDICKSFNSNEFFLRLGSYKEDPYYPRILFQPSKIINFKINHNLNCVYAGELISRFDNMYQTGCIKNGKVVFLK
tara:strand:- start:194 stop:964 length:771 start_codon:yes stop_codon:yes gene_type:complete